MTEAITLLGSTGSIGEQTLDVIARHPDRYRVFALTAHQNHAKLFHQCRQFHPRYAVLVDAAAAKQLQTRLAEENIPTEVLTGAGALEAVARSDEVTVVLAAIVGASGLLPTLAALETGKRVLLANKEALVMAGPLFSNIAQKHHATVLPVDSEHNAIFQSLPAGYVPLSPLPSGVSGLVLTASGGPFRTRDVSTFSQITPKEAVAHPNWSMGPKISVDSATMMNKGLEVVEAHYLFQTPLSNIEVILHPESVVHSMVRYEDGSVLAQLGVPDMRTPIANALAWPQRISAGVAQLNFTEVPPLTFETVDLHRYPCLALVYQAMKANAAAIVALNAANEVAVAAFLKGALSFDRIPALIEHTLERVPDVALTSIEAILAVDAQARQIAQENVAQTLHS